MKNPSLRNAVRRVALGSFLACGSLGLAWQLGCGSSHEPPKLDEASIEQKAQEQLDIRAQEMGGAKAP